MSAVILGGNECMTRQYKDLCQEYQCQAKVFIKMKGGLRNKLGNPDLLVVFTSTISRKMVRCALSETKSCETVIARSHSRSMASLRHILNEHVG